MPAIPEALAIALEHHVTGRLDTAEQIYRQILQVEPNHWDALQLLGTLAGQKGQHAQAVEFLSAALRVRGDQPTVHVNLGGAYFCLGNYTEALAVYRRALELKPDSAEAHYGLGLVEQAQGNLDDAAASFQRALQAKPDFVDALAHLGNVLANKGEQAEAVICYQRALQIQPDHAQVHFNLGTTQLAMGLLDEAATSYQRALQLRPNYVEAHANLGMVWKKLGRLVEATASLERALHLNGKLAPAHNTLGLIWQMRGHLDEALASFQRALDLDPKFAEAHSNLGNVLKDRGQLTEAITSYRHAVRLKPDYAEADSNLVSTLQFCPAYESRAIGEEQRRWHDRHARPLAQFIRLHDNDPSPGRRLRIGYISPDFRDHVIGRNVWPLISHHNHAEFEITLYANSIRGDVLTEQFRSNADHWCPIASWPDERVADRIRQDRIDILVDLALHLMGNRLLVMARKPAPVQVTFAGYPGSTGLDAIDYRLTDPYLDPPGGNDACHAEETYRLPHSFWCYDPQTEEPGVEALPALAKGFVTFGCLNNFCKINDEVLALWARALRAVRGSRLVLLAALGSHRRRTLDFLARQGIATDRVDFFSFQARHEYLALYHQVDIGLDTFPYNGHTTSLDSLWMGVPVLTLVGRTVVGRAGVSQLGNLGLPEWIAVTPEEWVTKAVALAGDLPRLSGFRATLRERMRSSPLMDAPGFARDIEAAYRDMWRRWCAVSCSAAPAAIDR